MREAMKWLAWITAAGAAVVLAFAAERLGRVPVSSGSGRTASTAADPAAPNASLRRFAEARQADDLFGLTRIWDFHLCVPSEEWDRMEPHDFRRRGPGGPGAGRIDDGPPGARAAEPAARSPEPIGSPGPPAAGNTFPYARGTLEAAGQTCPGIGVRFKGNSSFGASQGSLKRSLKLDFNRYQKGRKFLGLTKLNLNNNAMDPSQMREALAYSVFREAGLPAPRTAFARVHLSVPGRYEREYVGLYTVVEQVDDTFLRAQFGTKKGLLLKPEMMRGLEYFGAAWEPYARRFDPKSEVGTADAQRLIEFTRLIQEGEDASFHGRILDFLSVEHYLGFIAVQTALANLDSPLVSGHNYYLYLHPVTGQFQFLPWDLNEAFGGFIIGGRPEQQMHLSITRPFAGANRLFDRLMSRDELSAAFRTQFARLLEGPLARDSILAKVDAMASVIRDAVAADPNRVGPPFDQSLEAPWPAGATAATEDQPFVRSDQPLPGRLPRNGPAQANMAKPPLRPFIVGRLESIRAQLDHPTAAYTPTSRGAPPGPGQRPGIVRTGPAPVLAEVLRATFDRDQDGRLNPDELETGLKGWFLQWDQDQNQQVDFNELRAGLAAVLPPPPRRDGVAGRPANRPPSTPGMPPGTDRALDPRRTEPGRSAGETTGEPRERPLLELTRSFLTAADQDRDGQLTVPELSRAADRWSTSWDGNRDGSLDEPELMTGVSGLLSPIQQPRTGDSSAPAGERLSPLRPVRRP